jgi:hypothetical protein
MNFSLSTNCKIIRPILIGLWTVSVVCLLIALVVSVRLEAQIVLALLLGYTAHGLVAELIGVVITSKSISFPNHPIPDLPLITLWRKSVPARNFDRIDASGKSSVIIFKSGNPEIVRLPSRERRKQFLRVASKTYPHKHISGLI